MDNNRLHLIQPGQQRLEIRSIIIIAIPDHCEFGAAPWGFEATSPGLAFVLGPSAAFDF